MQELTLFGRPGWGSVLVEAQLAWYGIPFAYQEVGDLFSDAAARPWFLGRCFSALDIYICAMSHWRPGRAWFEAKAPTLAAIAERTKAEEKLSAVWARNYPDT